jgi:hypothetical protein
MGGIIFRGKRLQLTSKAIESLWKSTWYGQEVRKTASVLLSALVLISCVILGQITSTKWIAFFFNLEEEGVKIKLVVFKLAPSNSSEIGIHASGQSPGYLCPFR